MSSYELENDRLFRFFAVTLSSVYEIKDELTEDGDLYVVNIASNEDPEKGKVGTSLKGGDSVVISKDRLHVIPADFDPTTAPAYLKLCSHTSRIVGLFTNRDDAINAFAACSMSKPEPWDPRFATISQETCRLIGFDHPRFRFYLKDLPE